MLQNYGQALVEHEVEGIMICANDEVATPKVRPPMADRLDQADQLLFIRSEFQMTGHKRLAEEHEGTRALMEDHPKARPRCIAVHCEWLVEVWEMQDWGGG